MFQKTERSYVDLPVTTTLLGHYYYEGFLMLLLVMKIMFFVKFVKILSKILST